MRSLTYEGPTGTTRFDENGDVVGKAGVVLSVKNGQFRFESDLTKSINS